MLGLLSVIEATTHNTIWGLGVTWSIIIMLLISAVCGIVLGLERSIREKEAGVRTHVILILGATLFTVISCSFSDDGARIMAQIVTGVGFIGAGIIMFRGEALHGLTTAAGIWTTAGIGMAIGNGMIIIGVVATALVLVCQIVFHTGVNSKRKYYRYIRVSFVCNTDSVKLLKDTFAIKNFGRLKVRDDSDRVLAEAIMRTNVDCSVEVLSSMVEEHADILSLERLDVNRY